MTPPARRSDTPRRLRAARDTPPTVPPGGSQHERTHPTPEPAARGKRLLTRLNQPVDPGYTTANPVPTQETRTTPESEEDRRARTAAKSDSHYQRRLRNAHTTADPTALLMAHVDRIRALKNPALTRAAGAALAALISQNRPPPNRPGP